VPWPNDRIRDRPGAERSRWLALYVLCVGMLMIVLDATIVNVALPSIQRSLGFSQSNLRSAAGAAARRRGSETGAAGDKGKDYDVIWFTEQCLSNVLRLEEYMEDAKRDRAGRCSPAASPPERGARGAGPHAGWGRGPPPPPS
jgi:hypothetical protein